MARDCVEQTSKKYTSRKSPPYPANVCPVGDKKKGNDGKMYVVSGPNKNGVSRWVLEKTAKKSSDKKAASVKDDSVKAAKKPVAKKSSKLKPCNPGQVRNPKTNRCKKM